MSAAERSCAAPMLCVQILLARIRVHVKPDSKKWTETVQTLTNAQKRAMMIPVIVLLAHLIPPAVIRTDPIAVSACLAGLSIPHREHNVSTLVIWFVRILMSVPRGCIDAQPTHDA